eukprot:772912-Rhodomonas_salina.1
MNGTSLRTAKILEELLCCAAVSKFPMQVPQGRAAWQWQEEFLTGHSAAHWLVQVEWAGPAARHWQDRGWKAA